MSDKAAGYIAAAIVLLAAAAYFHSGSGRYVTAAGGPGALVDTRTGRTVMWDGSHWKELMPSVR